MKQLSLNTTKLAPSEHTYSIVEGFIFLKRKNGTLSAAGRAQDQTSLFKDELVLSNKND
jgi:hypothetical protein